MSVLSATKTSLILFAFGTALTALPYGAQAAMPDVATLQTQLQSEWAQFKNTLGPGVVSTGTVTVTQDGMAYKATLPSLDLTLQDQSKLQFAPIAIKASPDGSGALNLNIMLPSSIPQYRMTKKIGELTLGSQSLKTTVQPTGGIWQVQSLSGTLSNIQWKTTPQITSAAIGQITVNGQPNELQIRGQAISTTDPVGMKTTIENLSFTQKALSGKTMRLSDVLGLFTLITPQNSNTQGLMEAWMGSSAGGDITLKNLKTTSSDGKFSMLLGDGHLESAITNVANNMMTMKMVSSFNGIAIPTATSFATIIPQSIDFTGTMRNLPADYFNIPFNTPEGQEKAHAMLATANTQMQIESLKANTSSGVKMDGNGLLTANTIAPSYMAGTLNMNVWNLQDTLGKMQQQMTRGATTNGPAMMTLMLLQGMGKASPTNASQLQYNVMFSPTGEILINGQNISALAGMAGLGRKAAPAAMPAPVAPVAPAITPWKKP